MAKQKIVQTNFTAGELSPTMLGRMDTTRYQNGASGLSNMLVRQQGGLWYRQGSKFVGEVKDSSKATRIEEFVFSDTQPYVLEIGHLYVRVWYNNGFVETAPASGVPLEVVTPYTEADLPYLQFAQSADVLYITHPLYQPRKLRRLGANSWDIVLYENVDGPYLRSNVDATLTLTGYTNIATATASTAIFTPGAATKVITAIANQSGRIKYTVAAHGYATGNTVNIAHVLWQGVESLRPYGNGTYTITVIDVNNFYLNESKYIPYGVYTIAAATVALQGGSNYISYRQNNTWKLAQFVTQVSTTVATVYVLPTVIHDLGRAGARVTVSGTTVTSDRPGSFTSDDIGRYVRTVFGVWHQITAFLTETTCTVGAALSTVAYAYPETIVTLTNQTATAQIVSSVNLFAATDVGRHIRLNYETKQPWCKITTYVSATVVLVNVYGEIPVDTQSIQELLNNGATDVWKLGAWSDTTGYPYAVTFHEQRLWFGGSNTEPQTLWGSNSSDYDNMAPSEYDSIVLDSNAISYSFVSNTANPIIWLASSSTLLIGTLSAELKAQSASSAQQPLTPTNITITSQSESGSQPQCKAIKAGSDILFVQKAGRKLMQLAYSFAQDTFVTETLTIVNDHIFRQGGYAVNLAYQKEPNSMVWACLANGTLACLTYEKKEQVIAWHRHSLGGNGFVEAICSIPSVAGTEDVLYMLVRRTIDGVTKRYIEYITADFYPTSTLSRKDMYFLDGGLTYSGAPTTNITGLLHLKNSTVSVVSDGVYIGESTVSTGGVLTLAVAASTVHVGYKYRGTTRLLPLESPDPSMGKTRRVGATVLRLLDSLEFKYGMDLIKLDEKKVTTGNGITPSQDFFTGDVKVNMSMGYALTSQPYIVQDKPYPLTILAVGPDLEVTT